MGPLWAIPFPLFGIAGMAARGVRRGAACGRPREQTDFDPLRHDNAQRLLAKTSETWPEDAMRCWVLSCFAALWALSAAAGEVTVAVASNFLPTAEKIAAEFEAETGHEVVLSNGSTGLLYAQITNGAPFDVFLSADEERPDRLKDDGLALATRPYAIGALAVLSRIPLSVDTVREAFAGKTVALADPTVAPYGRAATRAMEELGLDTATFRPVMVANVGQVVSIFGTGNADFAFVATAQLDRVDAPFVLRLDGIAPDIRQDAALLSDEDAARAFWAWLERRETVMLIAADGYRTP